jgi:hypothetical protein
MTDFDSRWKHLARTAHEAADRETNESAPYGFATRVVALREKAALNYRLSLLALWHRLTLRAVGIALVLVILTVVLNASGDDDKLSPPIADSMADAFWPPQ